MNKRNFILVIKEWVEAFIYALILVVFFKTFFFQVYKIPTGSMIPTLMPGDRIFVSKLHYGPLIPFTHFRIHGFTHPKRGEIVVFVPPEEKKKGFFKKPYIKRLIGLEREKVLINKGNIYINGKIIIDPRIVKNNYKSLGPYGSKEVVVPKGKYFFLGDNSLNSYDSRYWGFVDEEDIIGKALFIWWPPSRIGKID